MNFRLAAICVSAAVTLTASTGLIFGQTPSSKLSALSQRERTFLQFVFDGDAAKSQEYAQAASINPNTIGGEPLSVWFYRLGTLGRGAAYEINAQSVVFGTFRQNANPQNIGPNNLAQFCQYAPVPQQVADRVMVMRLDGRARGPAWEAANRAVAEQQAPHIEAMADRFQSLLRYGLRDKAIIQAIFKACMAHRPFTMTPEFYDRLIAPMVQAGADINQPLDDGRRPVEMFVRAMDTIMVERLVKDGVRLDFRVKGDGCAQPTNLYVYLMNNVRPPNPTPIIGMVKLLSMGGLSPFEPVAYGGYQCKHRSYYDAALDTGDLRFAAAVKSMGEHGLQNRQMPTSPQPKAEPAPKPVQQAAALPAATPKQIGQWRITTETGRLAAVASASVQDGNPFPTFWLECVPGGRLEYYAPALKIDGPINALWLDYGGEVEKVPLVQSRASGATAVKLSKLFLAGEAEAKKAGLGDNWAQGMSVHGPDSFMSTMQMGGFGEVRAYLLANCKN